jgi:hypothetical protein
VASTISFAAEGGPGTIQLGIRCGEATRSYDLKLDVVRQASDRWSFAVRQVGTDLGGELLVSPGAGGRLRLGDSSLGVEVELVHRDAVANGPSGGPR